jgi:Helix-turn-helix domain
VTRPARSPRPLTIAEAAEYLGYRTTAAVRGLVKKQQLRPCGRGARDQHLFELSELDRYTRDRGLAYGAASGIPSETRAFSSVP